MTDPGATVASGSSGDDRGATGGVAGGDGAAASRGTIATAALRIEPAFLDGFEGGRRFGVWVEPPPGVTRLGGILCIQPFGDEATLARRVLTAQARRLAMRGWTTLIFDLFGTGDADGGTGDATLARWRSDLIRASRLARERAPGRFVVWGTRMGALLGADLLAVQDARVDAAVFWQPPVNGAALVDPLRKLAGVGAVARQAAAVDLSRASVAAPYEHILLAGYLLRRDLVDGLAALGMRPPEPGPQAPPCPVLMLGIQRVLPANGSAPKALAGLGQQWADAGCLPTVRAVQGEPFWSSLEPSTPDAVFEATEGFIDRAAR